MPATIFGYIWRVSGWHQLGLSALAVMVFLLTMAPLELQRRVVNTALGKDAFETVVLLCLAYAGLALLSGAIKLALNTYRGWVSESNVLSLRRTVYDMAAACHANHCDDPQAQGQTLAVMLAEVEPVGGFAGNSVSGPVLHAGILLSVFGYMLLLQPWMALLALLLFTPQLIFVPLMQRAITRRVRERIQTLRGVGAEMVGHWDGLGGAHRQGFDARVDRVFVLNMAVLRLKFSMNFLMNLMHHLGIAGVLLVGGYFVSRGELEIGTVVAFISGLARVNDPWGDLVDYFRELTIASAKYELVRDLFAAPSPQAVRQAAARPPVAVPDPVPTGHPW
jgi:ABC-type multidrug transport system fused ATPase/permease subunit